jgi:diacylglycerol kinase (ATP)
MADTQGISHLPRGPVGVWRATLWSLKGLRSAWAVESSFRLEVYLFLLLAPIGLYFGGSPLEKAWLVGCMLLVLSAELLNSAIEALIERYGPEHHELAGRAKDMGSAAVFMLMMNVLLSWGLLLGPSVLETLKGASGHP